MQRPSRGARREMPRERAVCLERITVLGGAAGERNERTTRGVEDAREIGMSQARRIDRAPQPAGGLPRFATETESQLVAVHRGEPSHGGGRAHAGVGAARARGRTSRWYSATHCARTEDHW